MNDSEKNLLLRHHFGRNTFSITAVEFFWGLAMPLIFESTYIQIFLRELGATNFQIGLMPVLLSLGIPLISLLSAYLTTHLVRKKTAVFLTNLFASVPIILLGLMFRTDLENSRVILFFYLFYAAFSFTLGLLLPVWQNFLVKIFLEKDTLRALSVMHISQSITRIIGSLALLKIVERYGISRTGAGNLFIIAGILMFAGSLFFTLAREIPERTIYSRRFTPLVFMKTLKSIIHNRKFIFFLLSDICYFAVMNVISFYAVYATEYCGIKPAYVSGLFITLNVTGSIIFQAVFGYFNLLGLKNKLYLEKYLSLAGITVLLFLPSLAGFLSASFLLGAGRSIRVLAYAPIIKKLSGQQDATPYFAAAPIIILPLSVGLPLFNGKFLDKFAYLGAFSFRIMFGLMAVLVAVSIFFLNKTDFNAGGDKRK